MRQTILAIVGAIILIGAFIFLLTRAAPASHADNTYAGSAYGFSFSYPESYALIEGDFGTPERMHHSITMANKEALANIPQGGEGPPAIIVQVFPNMEQYSIERWVRGSSDSNFKLSPDSSLATTTVAQMEALTYTWDGLYRGESVVLAHKSNIIMLSVTYDSPQDQIHSDFSKLLSTVTLY